MTSLMVHLREQMDAGIRFGYRQQTNLSEYLPIEVLRMRPPMGGQSSYRVLWRYVGRDEVNEDTIGHFLGQVKEL